MLVNLVSHTGHQIWSISFEINEMDNSSPAIYQEVINKERHYQLADIGTIVNTNVIIPSKLHMSSGLFADRVWRTPFYHI